MDVMIVSTASLHPTILQRLHCCMTYKQPTLSLLTQMQNWVAVNSQAQSSDDFQLFAEDPPRC